MRIAVCLPSGDMCHMDFCMALNDMSNYATRNRRDLSCFYINEKLSLLQVGRHRLVLQAMAHRCEYILFIDSDMIFSKDSITRLIDADRDIIGLQAVMRKSPNASNCYDFEGNQVLYDRNGITEVKYIGTGFLLVKTSVFEKIGMPYFRVQYREDQMPNWWGEDLDFCDRAREAGYKIYVHHELSKNLYHLGIKRYGYEKDNLS